MTLRAALLCALLGVPACAHAELYRWVDERGVINYSDQRPEGVKHVRQVDDARVSTLPTPPPGERERLRERALEARIERLEREIAALERERVASPPVVVVPAVQPTFVAGPVFWPAWGVPVAHGRFVRGPRFHGGFHGGVRVGIGRPARR